MKIQRAVSLGLVGFGVFLAGCPIYPDSRDHRICVGSDCYACPDDSYSGQCTSWTCNSPLDCPSNYTCGSDQHCQLAGTPPVTPGTDGSACTKPSDCGSNNCGADNKCHPGDCSTSGCPSSYVCRLAGGTPTCSPLGGADGGVSSTCKSDKDCPTPAGSKCLTGSCVAPQDQCADTTQCAAGAQCVQGACTPSCSASKACPTGYACDSGKGVCTQNPTPCTDSSSCGGKVCVEQHCVDPCSGAGTCGAGLVCVDGGCTPDEQPVFTCKVDGAQDSCQPGSMCLRHSCYIACGADAGADACKTADQFNQCKAVTTGSGTFNVCGSTSNLGTDCDPTQGKNCTAPAICIDGYCK
jgi:hypothetical protein